MGESLTCTCPQSELRLQKEIKETELHRQKEIREVAVPLTQVIHGQTWRLIGGLTILGVVFKLADVFLQ